MSSPGGFCPSYSILPIEDQSHLRIELLLRHPRQGVLWLEGSMVERDKARFYGAPESWGDLDLSGARGFRAGVAHKLAHC